MYGQCVLLTENVVEEVAVIVVGLKSLVQSWSTLIIQKIFFSAKFYKKFCTVIKKKNQPKQLFIFSSYSR